MPTKKSKTKRERAEEPASKGISFETYVPTLITRLASLLSSNASRYYRKRWGIGMVEWRIIHVLAKHPQLNARDIAEKADLDKAAVSRGLRNLEHDCLVDIGQETPRAREIRVSLNSRGLGIYREILKASQMREAILLEGVTEADRRQLTRTIAHLIRRVPDMDRYDGD